MKDYFNTTQSFKISNSSNISNNIYNPTNPTNPTNTNIPLKLNLNKTDNKKQKITNKAKGEKAGKKFFGISNPTERYSINIHYIITLIILIILIIIISTL